MTDKQDAPPLMPKFGLGDIVSITGKYAQDWCQANLMIVQVSYDHKTDLLTYSTVIAGDPLSEGMTTDWSETDFCLIERNKYNARQALTAPKVDVEWLKAEQRRYFNAYDQSLSNALYNHGDALIDHLDARGLFGNTQERGDE